MPGTNSRMFMNYQSRQKVATIISLAFHISGLIAMVVFRSALFIRLTPLNLLVSAALICWTQEKINASFVFFVLFSYIAGFGAEYIGVNTGYLFGDYTYSDLLGKKWQHVPLIIGLQWTITIYCIGISMSMLHDYINKQRLAQTLEPPEQKAADKKWRALKFLSMIIDGALLAVLFDWVIEPAAVKLGYWQWSGGEVPVTNYYSWAGTSLPVMMAFYFLSFKKQNQFAVNLLLIQFMFFLLLNRFY